MIDPNVKPKPTPDQMARLSDAEWLKAATEALTPKPATEPQTPKPETWRDRKPML